MNAEPALVSFFEISPGLGVRLGAGTLEEILRGPPGNLSICVCLREPPPEGVRFRMRFGTATISEEDPVLRFSGDELERRGMWLASYPLAVHAIRLLHSLPVPLVGDMVPVDAFPAWLALDMESMRVRAIQDPHSWVVALSDKPEEAEVLVRLEGEPDQLLRLLADHWDAIEAAQLRDAME